LQKALKHYPGMMKENKTTERGHDFYMKFCIDLALIAKARGDSPVGAVVVQDGVVIAEGIEGGKAKKDNTFHAEIEAIREANIITGNNDLYVIRHAKIQAVVFGISGKPPRIVKGIMERDIKNSIA
jgi:deoxycytidylate deaminase